METDVAATPYRRSNRHDSVARLWSTNVSLGRVSLSEGEGIPLFDRIGNGPAFEVQDLSSLMSAAQQIETLFLDSMRELAAADREQGLDIGAIDHVDLSLQVWRGGYELPICTSRGPYLGWLFLHGTPSQHSDSGTVAVLDPRAGASMSAVPGMPWGTVLTIRPERGNLAIVPGWLTSSVLPLEEHQTCVVVAAEACGAGN